MVLAPDPRAPIGERLRGGGLLPPLKLLPPRLIGDFLSRSPRSPLSRGGGDARLLMGDI